MGPGGVTATAVEITRHLTWATGLGGRPVTASVGELRPSFPVDLGRAIQEAEAHTGVGGPGTAACSGDLLLGDDDEGGEERQGEDVAVAAEQHDAQEGSEQPNDEESTRHRSSPPFSSRRSRCRASRRP